MVVAACVEAETDGRKVVTLAPGHYQLDGLDVDGVHGRYLVGDGVTFTETSWVYPFDTGDLALLSAKSGRSGGRGRIAIEVDDGLDVHWFRLFPITKALGITVGTAWHTGQDSKWIAEAYRHGWEVINHLPENITATEYLATGTLETAITSGLAKIKAQIGTDKGLGFVYPQHVRSLETDRVLSKYFTRGRGVNGGVIYERGAGHPWLTTAQFLDPNFTGGVVSEYLKDNLRNVAAMDGDMVFYMHLAYNNADSQIKALTEFIALAREQGIEVVNPGQIWGDTNLITDSYLEDTPQWSLGTNMAWDTTQKYHGTRSVKYTHPGMGNTGASLVRHSSRKSSLTPRAGMFSVHRMSVRVKTDGGSTSGVRNGLWFGVQSEYRTISGGDPVIPAGGTAVQPLLPASGATIPAMEWERVQGLTYIGPATLAARFSLTLQNIADGTTPIWFDEIKAEHVGYVAQAAFRGTLAGTGNVWVLTGVHDLARHHVSFVPDTPMTGVVTWVPSSNNGMIIKSTNAADTMGVTVIVRPGDPYENMALSSEGA